MEAHDEDDTHILQQKKTTSNKKTESSRRNVEKAILARRQTRTELDALKEEVNALKLSLQQKETQKDTPRSKKKVIIQQSDSEDEIIYVKKNRPRMQRVQKTAIYNHQDDNEDDVPNPVYDALMQTLYRPE
jgi:hypothetical protein